MSDTLNPLIPPSDDTTDSLAVPDSTVLPKLGSNLNKKSPARKKPTGEKTSDKATVILPQTVSSPEQDTATKPITVSGILAKSKKKITPKMGTEPSSEKSSARQTDGKNAGENPVNNVADWMDREYRGISIYAVLMGVLLTLILWTGISTVRQIQAYHHQYTELQKIKKDYRKLQVEHQRLLIEQQTFSATPQIARRAVTELNMFYPKLSDRLIVQQPAPVVTPTTAPSTDEVAP